MAVCGLRTLLLIVCVLQLVVTVQRQIFDFLGYMWLPIIANFLNILLIIFGSFGAVQYITKYLVAYAIWCCMWLTWNIFLICYYLNAGSLNRESGLLSLGTGSVSWWESNGWGCQPVWGEVDGPGTWRPARVDGCFMQWQHVELGQSALTAILTATALPLTVLVTYHSLKKQPPSTEKGTLPRRQVYTIEFSPAEMNVSESSLKPMTPRRVKRRSGSRSAQSSVRRSRRSYRNAGYLASNASLPRESRSSRPTSAHSSYSNFHGTRPPPYLPERDNTSRSEEIYQNHPPIETLSRATSGYDTIRVNRNVGQDVVGPYNEPSCDAKSFGKNTSYDDIVRYQDRTPGYESRESEMGDSRSYAGNMGYGMDDNWEPPPPAPPYSGSRATPQAPGPPAYQPTHDAYNMMN